MVMEIMAKLFHFEWQLIWGGGRNYVACLACQQVSVRTGDTLVLPEPMKIGIPFISRHDFT